MEKIFSINDCLKSLTDFIQNDDTTKSDFQDYLATVGEKCSPEIAIPYIFERRLNSKDIIEIFLEKTKKMTKGVRTILTGLLKAQSSVFEIKKILKDGFRLYNLINERDYDVISIAKMTHYRGVGVGQYVVARIFESEGEYYLLEISSILSASQKDDAMRYAVAKIIENPAVVYRDNPQKQSEIEKNVKKMHKSFTECFENDEIVTTNKFADDVIGIFNDFAETGAKGDLEGKIQSLDEYKFFKVRDFNNSYENFLEKSLGGFSSHSETYDVGIIFDKIEGLYAVPFYETFNKVFEQKIENGDKCVEYFLTNDAISANIIKRVAEKHPNFMDVVNKILKTKMTFDELLQKYKSKFLEEKIFSSTTVLYDSKVFNSTLGSIEDKESRADFDFSNVSRNDRCPCGSGKKFKQCCMLAI